MELNFSREFQLNMQNAIVFTHNLLAENFAKTAHGLLRGTDRYNVVAVIDSLHYGKDAGEVLDGKKINIPVYKSVTDFIDASDINAELCIVGVAFPGGILPKNCREELIEAIKCELSIVSGLHHYLSEDSEFVALANQHNVKLIDIRKPKPVSDLRFWSGKILDINIPIIAVLGTDCAVGKRTTSRLILENCKKQNINAELIYTGQTGWMQGYQHGFIFDATPNDFVSGELERAILECVDQSNPELILLEGQSSLRNPSGPGGSELILSGNAKSVIIVHPIARKYFVDLEEFEYEIPDLIDEIKLIESYGANVIGVGINEENATEDELIKFKNKYSQLLKIPVVLPLTDGVDDIVSNIKENLSL